MYLEITVEALFVPFIFPSLLLEKIPRGGTAKSKNKNAHAILLDNAKFPAQAAS